jgi:hypothetical protein
VAYAGALGRRLASAHAPWESRFLVTKTRRGQLESSRTAVGEEVDELAAHHLLPTRRRPALDVERQTRGRVGEDADRRPDIGDRERRGKGILVAV